MEQFKHILNYKQKPSLMTNYSLPANGKDCHNPAHRLTTEKREKRRKHEREVDSKESCWFLSSSWGWVIWASISRDRSTRRETANRVEQQLSLLIWLNSSLSRWNGCFQVKKRKERKEQQKACWGIRLLLFSDDERMFFVKLMGHQQGFRREQLDPVEMIKRGAVWIRAQF